MTDHQKAFHDLGKSEDWPNADLGEALKDEAKAIHILSNSLSFLFIACSFGFPTALKPHFDLAEANFVGGGGAFTLNVSRVAGPGV